MTTDPVALKRDKSEVWQELRRELFSPFLLACALVILAQIWWLMPVTYFFLWTYRAVPSGLIPIAVALLFCGTAFGFLGKFFTSAFRWSKSIQPFRVLARSGDQQAIREMIALRKNKPRFLHFVAFHLFILLSISPAGALLIISEDMGGQYAIRDHGKLRLSTRNEDVEKTLKAIQAQGVFRRIGD